MLMTTTTTMMMIIYGGRWRWISMLIIFRGWGTDNVCVDAYLCMFGCRYVCLYNTYLTEATTLVAVAIVTLTDSQPLFVCLSVCLTICKSFTLCSVRRCVRLNVLSSGLVKCLCIFQLSTLVTIADVVIVVVTVVVVVVVVESRLRRV